LLSLKKQGAVIIRRKQADEFIWAISNEHSAYGNVKKPLGYWASSGGGSSGGSAV
jgi:Asp-tRNA(Asn)/Glu-tRNA(Gln) amidotransferase A subunit family amidase